MKKCILAIVFLSLLTSIFGCTLAEEIPNLIWQGFNTRETLKNNDNPYIYRWKGKENELISIEQGELIFGDGQGYYLSKYKEESGTVEIFHFVHDKLESHNEFSLGRDAKRICAYVAKRIYYSYVVDESNYGIGIYDVDSKEKTFINLKNLVYDEKSVEVLMMDVNSAGYIAFIGDRKKPEWVENGPDGICALYSIINGEINIVAEDALAFNWLDDQRIVFVDENHILKVYDIKTENISIWQTKKGENIYIHDIRSNIFVDQEGRYIGFSKYVQERFLRIIPMLDTNWQPLAVISLDSGNTVYSKRVLLHLEELQFEG